MKIKSLLLGSAAAMAVATTGASAADAIIAAEPEPVEYVRVCDAFGSGYFYIPGTETCLKFSGLVRMRILADSEDAFGLGGDSYRTNYRARLTIDAKSDTELGELHGRLRIQGDSASPTADADALIDQAYLQLGGLFAGYSESAWVYSTNGGASGFGGKGIYDGRYGYQQRNMLQYQFNGSNFFAAISLEDDADATSWTPDVVGRLGGVFGGVTVFGVVAYDQENGTGTDEFGVKLGLNADIGSAGNLIVQGFYASGFTAYGANLSYAGLTWTPEWSILVAYGHDLTSSITAYINGQYFSDFYSAANVSTGVDAWSVSGGFKWSPVTNFSVTTEARYTDVDLGAVVIPGVVNDDFWEFVVQLQRDF